ncbi:MAG: 1-acyl-sn-glycerol-3-phosphate acyltransferase [Phenylobacterium sp.]|uniref:lysophospholipid acyltransferase family protein n=1 Tax=Phenylobacterium sp. TaxID=1871053 RepID=UPI0025DD046C|nr:lysophospholipid acyltransferase family protein [Phenylobacterium sp.]MCA6299645.1 1-acyl-sn-glycerol-3-phosphate acyltransferase [Phenylobacterium sp.]
MILLRSFLFAIVFYAWSVVWAIAMVPMLAAPRSWLLAGMRFWSRSLNVLLKVICGIGVEIRGQEHVPSADALIASKHQTMFDVFVQFGVLKGSLFVFKKELLIIPIFGWIALKIGSIVVDREKQATALRDMVRRAQEQFRLGDRQLVIFPEGTRKAPGAPPDYKPGVAGLYRELGVAVHPVATNAGVHWPAHGFLRRPGVIVYQYLEPIPPGLKRAEFMRILEERIETASNRLLAEGL